MRMQIAPQRPARYRTLTETINGEDFQHLSLEESIYKDSKPCPTPTNARDNEDFCTQCEDSFGCEDLETRIMEQVMAEDKIRKQNIADDPNREEQIEMSGSDEPWNAEFGRNPARFAQLKETRKIREREYELQDADER